MKLTEGQARINGLHVMEVTVKNHPDTGQALTATYALCRGDQRIGDLRQPTRVSAETHGKCTALPNNWSPRTLEILGELLGSMEDDLLPRHFDVGATEESDERFGIGADEDAPQV